MSSTNDASTDPQAGFSLIEVIVAMLVFAIISVGVITAVVTITRMTADNRSREIATNLAEQDMDAVRTIGNPFNVHAATTSTTVSGRTYTVVRSTSWQTVAGTDITCGSASNLYSRRVNDTVTWTGQLATTQPVRTDTLLAPIGRISSASTGTISISVLSASGAALPGVAVTITPTSGGAALAAQPAATDVDGCSFAAQVTPGTYSVTLSRTNSIDATQSSSSTSSVIVPAGSTVPVTYTYDTPATYVVSPQPSTALLPTNFTTTFTPYSASSTSPCVATYTAAGTSLFPFGTGYKAVAGATGSSNTTPTCGALNQTTTCLSDDPSQWPATSTLASGVPGSAAAAAGASATIKVNVGVVNVTSLVAGYLTAVSATPSGTGNPGCGLTQTFTFGKILKAGTITAGLPYGSWTLYWGATAGAQTLQIAASQLSTNNVSATGNGVTTSGLTVITTLDPRTAK